LPETAAAWQRDKGQRRTLNAQGRRHIRSVMIAMLFSLIVFAIVSYGHAAPE